jgi:hypothetical protein
LRWEQFPLGGVVIEGWRYGEQAAVPTGTTKGSVSLLGFDVEDSVIFQHAHRTSREIDRLIASGTASLHIGGTSWSSRLTDT